MATTTSSSWTSIYSVHCSKQVVDTIRLLHPRCHLAFISAHMTPCAQPLDVAYNGPIKHYIWSCMTRHFARNVAAACQSEEPVARVDLCIGTLRPLLGEWIRQAFRDVGARQELHSRAWPLCTATADEEHRLMEDKAHVAFESGTLFSDEPLIAEVVETHEHAEPTEADDESEGELHEGEHKDGEQDHESSGQEDLGEHKDGEHHQGERKPEDESTARATKRARMNPEHLESKLEASAAKAISNAEKCGFLAAIYGRYAAKQRL